MWFKIILFIFLFFLSFSFHDSSRTNFRNSFSLKYFWKDLWWLEYCQCKENVWTFTFFKIEDWRKFVFYEKGGEDSSSCNHTVRSCPSILLVFFYFHIEERLKNIKLPRNLEFKFFIFYLILNSWLSPASSQKWQNGNK